MRIKLDENIGRRGVDLLRRQGHDVETVRDEELHGAPDQAIYAACVVERRTLVTLDRDFSQVLRFPPGPTAGLVVLDPGRPVTLPRLLARIEAFMTLARSRRVEGELWIVEPGRVRVHLDRDAE
ncbi:DUF5615 family PIN-like protein [Rhodoplanes sp. SY1]|uniref:DUF5615 family PIN-like protein n=1 Tax=Rhodoplanes sp. SY1 TaxID=3166646 RepID=UPI0038B51984